MFGIPEWFIIVAAFGAAIVTVYIICAEHYTTHIPQEIPEPDTYIPVFMDMFSTEYERAEYRELSSRNRQHFNCIPGVQRSTTCPFKKKDSRNDYVCGWCCVPARKRNYLPL